MNRDLSRSKMFTRRAALLFGGKLALSAVLLGRMYQLQVIQADRYRTLAEENRIHMRLLAPLRGRIVDRFGEPLAINRDNYRVLLVAEQTPHLETTLSRLGEVIDLPDADRRRILREVHKRRSFVPVTVRENLPWEEVARIQVRMPDLPGVLIDVGQSREYPMAARAAHLVGYVGAVSEKETTGDPLLDLPGFRIGKNGIEKVRDLDLRGRAGASQLEVNAVGRVIRELDRQEGEAGADVALSIDAGLQEFATARLSAEESAACVVLDVRSGEVLAMVSTPGYDPNAFARGLTTEYWNSLIKDLHTPLINKSIAGLYAPGSTFKPVVALAALEGGVAKPGEKVFCRGHLELGNARFHCWKKGGHGWVDMREAISHSCDVFFYDLARRVGIQRIAVMAERLGMGGDNGLDLPGVKSGLVPTPKWKRAALKQPWHPGETLIAGIGQGYVLTTPMQLAVMTARIANREQAVRPTLVRSVAAGAVGGRPPAPLGIADSSLQVVIDGMDMVTNHARGTAYRSRITERAMAMAGKTGTSQVRRITQRERETRVLKNEELPWRERDHALFIGFAPVEAPRYATAVVVEHGGGGSAVAAPIARDVLIETQRRESGARPGNIAGDPDMPGRG